MKAVVVGASGLVGTRVVRHLRSAGVEVTEASPTLGIDAVTGVGLAEALEGAKVVVDVADSPSYDGGAASDHFRISTRHLLDGGATAGVEHYVVLSVVGVERLVDSGYMRAKLEQEAFVRAGGLPYTIVRSTHTFELLSAMIRANGDNEIVRISPALVQPIAAEDLASVLTIVASAAAPGGTREAAGPDRVRLAEFAAKVLRSRRDTRSVVSDPEVRFFETRLDDRTLLPGPAPWIGPTLFAEWLGQPSVVGGRPKQADSAH